MTRNQLKRRATIVDAFIDLIVEAGAEATQMRNGQGRVVRVTSDAV
ncbi:hypothetical protein K3U93_08190 [Mycobacterium malmoense]|nr:hypothetical protein [Mycobacterium malmoense]QZA19096.1 hypothetical protein K3U93_08190 [Mycobacterium malmoense]UNB95858.1 hypothetical protein H5T25_08180 [Mycobacterium malmoense]